MLITKALESMRGSLAVSEHFAKSAERTKKQFEALCITPKIAFLTNNLASNIRFNKPIFDKPTSFQNFESANPIRQELFGNHKQEQFFTDPLKLIDIPLLKQPKEKPQVNLIIINVNGASLDKETINKNKPKICMPPKKKKSVQQLENMNNAINELIAKVKEHNIFIDKNEMPGTKKEFTAILKKLYPQVFNLKQATLNDNYFPDIGLKFQPGVHRNTCDTIKKLQSLFG